MEHIDALEAVRRLTLERDTLAEQVRRLEERQTIIMQKRDDTIQDLAFARADIKRLTNGLERAHATINALQAPERPANPETGTEAGEGANGAPRETTEPQKWDGLIFGGRALRLKERYNGTQTRDGCRHGRHSLCDKMVCTRHAPKHGEHMGARGYWPLVSREDACGDWEGK